MPISRSEQSRINGAKSRGPKTAEGKARSSLNAVKHGRYATNAVVLSNEDPNAFENLVARYVQRIQPADSIEYNLVRELASFDWRLARGWPWIRGCWATNSRSNCPPRPRRGNESARRTGCRWRARPWWTARECPTS